jgi:hypothetical protein
MNKHDGTFDDRALDADVAFNMDGEALSGMGVDAGDFTGNGFPGFAVTNFSGERHSLFVNPGKFPFVATNPRVGYRFLHHALCRLGQFSLSTTTTRVFSVC